MIQRILTFACLALSLCAARGQNNITVYSSGTLERGTSRQLSACVPLSPNTVTWSVNGIDGGDAAICRHGHEHRGHVDSEQCRRRSR